jgi:ubiquinone biosynthesis monooxygenase Coq7
MAAKTGLLVVWPQRPSTLQTTTAMGYSWPMLRPLDPALVLLDTALRTLSGGVHAARTAPPTQAPELTPEAKRLSGALMRVNHVGEVCAQALYQAQALTARSASLRTHMAEAARDEVDHLAWTEQRLRELGDHPSRLNPLWYAGAFGIGLLAGRLGDPISLGFVAETERQVEQHLAGHLDRLPTDDTRSRAIVEEMKRDEARHAEQAESAGATPMPAPVRWLMKAAARVMTGTAHHI